MADNATKIAALETAIGNGVRTVVVDGQTVTYASVGEMLKALDYLKRNDTANDYPVKRRITRVALNGGGAL